MLDDDFYGEYECEQCGQKHWIDKSGKAKKVFEELKFNSFLSFNEFVEKFQANNIAVSKLIIKDISDNDNFFKIIMFKDCIIDDLIIENIDSYTTCFPIAFVNCNISNISIKNSIIVENPKKDFWGSYHFYGISIFNCNISNSFKIDGLQSSVCMANSTVECNIEILKSTIPDFNLLHNNEDPVINFDSSSVIEIYNTHINTDLESVSQKTLKNKTLIEGKTIKELDILEGFSEDTTIRNSIIKKLTFHSETEVYAALTLENCIIHSVSGNPGNIHRSLIFKNCRFVDKVHISKGTFHESFIAEGCVFEKDLVFDDSTINNDLQLSYSYFAKDVDITHTNIQGYLVFHFSSFEKNLFLDRSTINRNLIMSASLVNMETKLTNMEISGEVYFTLVDFLEGFKIEYLNGELVSVSSCRFFKDVILDDLVLSNSLSLRNSVFEGSFKVSSLILNDYLKIFQSVFYGPVNFMLCEIEAIMMYFSVFKDTFDIFQFPIRKHSYFQDNIFTNKVDFDELQARDIDIKDNIFSSEFEIQKSEMDDLIISDNQFQDFQLVSCISGEIQFEGNKLSSWYVFRKLVCNKTMSLSNNDMQILYGGIISSTFNNEFHIVGNSITGIFEITNNTINQDFEIQSNIFNEEGQLSILRNTINNINVESSKFFSPVFIIDNIIIGLLGIGLQISKVASERITFSRGVSVSNNRIRTFNMFNAGNIEAFCFLNNHVEGETIIKGGYFTKELDLSGSYLGGSVKLSNINFSHNLILNDTFIDKRISFNNSEPKYMSFVGASLKGFNIPDNWQMFRFKLHNTSKKTKYIIHDDYLMKSKTNSERLSYNILKSYWQEYHDFINLLHVLWNNVVTTCFNDDDAELFKSEIELYDSLALYRELINDFLKQEFIPVYYGISEEGGLENIIEITEHFSVYTNSSKDKSVIDAVENITSFFEIFSPLLLSFKDGYITEEIPEFKFAQFYEKKLTHNLMDQYMVVRQIYSENGELGNEDKAYYSWMHFKNLNEMKIRPWYYKPLNWFRWLVFEKIFGWGVALSRILISTLSLVLVFTGIYKFLFSKYPELEIQLDGASQIANSMSIDKVLLLSLQTTFGAFMGDWIPTGNSGLKLLMTINAVLGVLFVTFMIGAYGRKMLR